MKKVCALIGKYFGVIAVIFLIIERFVLIRLIAEILGFVRTVF